jgi:pimeloyl-ACP methyl ester carboxylesterase
VGAFREVTLSKAVDGFRLAYDRTGSGPAVVLLHGWPGARSDQAEVARLLSDAAEVVVPDLRGFGASEGPAPGDANLAQFDANGQARSVLGLIDELKLDRPVVGGYDVGSRVAQAVARARPDAVRALVLAPPLAGAGDRVLTAEAQREFWYQAFHRLPLADRLVDGNPSAVRAYLEHFWSHWSAPDWTPPSSMLDDLTGLYARPGAFVASIAWYRAGAGTIAVSVAERAPAPDERIQVPTTVLWPEHDPLFPFAWADRLGEFFTDVNLRQMPGVGHFSPLEAPDAVAAAVRQRLP